jgi:hypothetical protein
MDPHKLKPIKLQKNHHLMMEILSVKGLKVLNNILILALEGRIMRNTTGLLGIPLGRGARRRDRIRVLEMAITHSTRDNLVSSLVLQQLVLVLDVGGVGLHAGEAARDDLVVDAHNGVLGDVL